jgi:hypothetical protein
MLAVQSGPSSDQLQVLDPGVGASSLRTLDTGQFDQILGW